MKGTYEVTDGKDSRAIAAFLEREGRLLLPMVELVSRAEMAIDEVIEVMGRATIVGDTHILGVRGHPLLRTC